MRLSRLKRLRALLSSGSELSPVDVQAALSEWTLWARPEQLEPQGDWRKWVILSGRGWGKTRVGSEWVRAQLEAMPGCRVAIVARTYSDARDTCVEGESGLLSCLPEDERAKAKWNRSLGEGALSNGSQWKVFSAEEPDSLRGPQFHCLWADEMASWKKGRDAWRQVPFIVRLPWRADPSRAGRIVVTTTPRPVAEIRELLTDPKAVVVRGSSFDNWRNLNALTRAELEKLRHTRLGRQELFGEILDDTPGALWKRATIDRQRVGKLPDFGRIVVAIDPSVTSGEKSDETGIIVAGRADLKRGARRYVIADRSLRGAPHEWAKAAIEAYREFKADCIVVETNNGGEMCKATLKAIDSSVPVSEVHASRGKRTRAEPVAASYEQGEVYHAAGLTALEDQLCTWTDDSDWSPDRLDAMVWAMAALHTSPVEVRVKPPKYRATGLGGLDL